MMHKKSGSAKKSSVAVRLVGILERNNALIQRPHTPWSQRGPLGWQARHAIVTATVPQAEGITATFSCTAGAFLLSIIV